RSPARTGRWPRWEPCGRTRAVRVPMRAKLPSAASVPRTCAPACSPTPGCDMARIVLAGYLVRNPLGGYAWQVAHYLAGLRALGHDAWFYEDTGHYALAYDPVANTFGLDYDHGVRAAGGVLTPPRLGNPCVFSYSQLR